MGIGRCEGGPGVPLIIRSPKLQIRARDPEGPKMGVSQHCTTPTFLNLVSLAHGPQKGVQKAPPCGPLRVQLPIVWFWAPEGEWGCGIWKGGCPAVCILGGGYERPTVCIFGRSSPKRWSHCVRPQHSRCATGMDATFLSVYIGE